MGKKYSAKSDGSDLFVDAAPSMVDDPALARILEATPTRPLSTSLKEVIKPHVVRRLAHLLYHEAEEHRLQECSDRRAEDDNAAAARKGYPGSVAQRRGKRIHDGESERRALPGLRRSAQSKKGEVRPPPRLLELPKVQVHARSGPPKGRGGSIWPLLKQLAKSIAVDDRQQLKLRTDAIQQLIFCCCLPQINFLRNHQPLLI